MEIKSIFSRGDASASKLVADLRSLGHFVETLESNPPQYATSADLDIVHDRAKALGLDGVIVGSVKTPSSWEP